MKIKHNERRVHNKTHTRKHGQFPRDILITLNFIITARFYLKIMWCVCLKCNRYHFLHDIHEALSVINDREIIFFFFYASENKKLLQENQGIQCLHVFRFTLMLLLSVPVVIHCSTD